MQKANLFITVLLLLAVAVGFWRLSGKLPTVSRDADKAYKPMRLTQQMLADTAKNMLERQVSVQVLQWDD